MIVREISFQEINKNSSKSQKHRRYIVKKGTRM